MQTKKRNQQSLKARREEPSSTLAHVTLSSDVVEDEVVFGHAGGIDRAADNCFPSHCTAENRLNQIYGVLFVDEAPDKLGVVRRPACGVNGGSCSECGAEHDEGRRRRRIITTSTISSDPPIVDFDKV